MGFMKPSKIILWMGLMGVGLMAGNSGCSQFKTAEGKWLDETTTLFRTVQGVEIEVSNSTRTDMQRFTVTNSLDIASIRNALPSLYMRKAHSIAEQTNQDFIMVAYPDSGALKDNRAYPATCIFVLPNGLVFHGRGCMTDPDYHGYIIPKYRDAVTSICLKYGIPADKLKNFPPCQPQSSP